MLYVNYRNKDLRSQYEIKNNVISLIVEKKEKKKNYISVGNIMIFRTIRSIQTYTN